MTLSKEIERTTLEEHKKANAGNSGNHYYYKQLSYKAERRDKALALGRNLRCNPCGASVEPSLCRIEPLP